MKKRILTFAGMCDFLLFNEREAKELFFTKNFTARQVANHFGIHFTKNWPKACAKILGTKGMGLGGARFGAGNFSPENRPPKPKQRQFFVFEFSPEIANILRSQGSGHKHVKYVEEAIFWYERNKNPEQ